nr:hypothetical protein [Brucella intermedia]
MKDQLDGWNLRSTQPDVPVFPQRDVKKDKEWIGVCAALDVDILFA